MTQMRLNPTKEAGIAQAEEIRFFRSFGWDDRQVARRLEMDWTSFLRFVSRHPELGPVNDPEQRERARWAEFQAAVSTRKRGSRNG